MENIDDMNSFEEKGIELRGFNIRSEIIIESNEFSNIIKIVEDKDGLINIYEIVDTIESEPIQLDYAEAKIVAKILNNLIELQEKHSYNVKDYKCD